MNNKQRNVIKVSIALIIAAMLYPPFHLDGAYGMSVGAGYGFIFSPPEDRALVYVPQLMAEWIAILIASLGFFLLFKKVDEKD